MNDNENQLIFETIANHLIYLYLFSSKFKGTSPSGLVFSIITEKYTNLVTKTINENVVCVI